MISFSEETRSLIKWRAFSLDLLELLQIESDGGEEGCVNQKRMPWLVFLFSRGGGVEKVGSAAAMSSKLGCLNLYLQ